MSGRIATSPLLTDLYQLTMAYGHYRLGRGDSEGIFNLFFRKTPFSGGFAVVAGLASAIETVRQFRFTQDELAYLGTLRGADERPLFEADFLTYLADLRPSLDIDAMPEGTVAFAHEPILRVRGSLLEAQLLETVLLNQLNFETLIATKAARIALATRGEPILEFGLRRAQGVDGALHASRAAYLGGCSATSNVLAGKLYGIPVRGTHAHSWVMSFDTELEAFEAYADALPNNCVFLVDTYDTLDGVRHAIQVGERLRAQGQRLLGIRLDSGDLAWLSQQARQLLDEAGFRDTAILASNDLDEHLIRSLKDQGAAISVWGVGTRLVTAYDQPALGGVYKLSAVRRPGQPWQPRIKLSEQAAKISIPGELQVRRFTRDGQFVADAIYDEQLGCPEPCVVVHPGDPTRQKVVRDATSEDLLVPVFRGGQLVYDAPSLQESRARALDQVAKLHATVKRFDNPHDYPAGLERDLHTQRHELIARARGLVGHAPGSEGP